MSLAMGYTSDATPTGIGVSLASLSANNFFFEITDTFIDLRGLLSGPINKIFSTVETFLEPIRPILDLLTSEVPVLSDISKLAGAGAITVLDVIRATGDGDYDGAVAFIEAVADVDDMISTLGGLRESSKISLGSLKLPAGIAGSSSAAVLRAKLAEGAVAPDFAAFDAGTDIAKSPRDATGTTAHAYNEVTAGSVSFPMFEKPVDSLIDILFGGNPTLVLWDMPDLRAGFRLEQSFPIFPPLFAKFFGGFEFATDFSLGYDTRGIRQAMAGAEVRANKVLNGVFLGDVDAGGVDKPELTFTATVGAGAELNVVVAKVGVDAGVEGVLGANLKDNNGDGKVHLDELLGNLRSGPECIFDLEGSIDAFFEAYIKVGFSTPFGFVTLWKDTFELLRLELFGWEMVTCPPVTPSLYHVVDTLDPDGSGPEAAGKALVINAGPSAGLVLSGETEDGDEEFEIDYDAVRGEIVIRGYDYEAREPAAGLNWIWFDAGLGNDIITVTANVMIPVYGSGGPGNDRLTGGGARNILFGDSGSVTGTAGRDKLMGRAAADQLVGDAGNDILLGFGGNDTLDGGAGADQLYGDDETGDMVDVPDGFGGGASFNDTIWGGDGDDMIVAGKGIDTVYASAGDDTVDGGSGDDFLEGGSGNDKLYGRDGFDRIYGDGFDRIYGVDAADAITALGRGVGDGSAVNVNADLIEGGTGFNYIDGGPGFDLIYAESAAVGVEAAATHGTKNVTLATHGFAPVLVATGWLRAEAARGSGLFKSVILGGDGNDTIYGTAGRDYIDAGFDSDLVEFGAGDDYVLGGPGSDALVVSTNPDLGVVGGNATIFGGDGRDVIDGGAGVNWIEGGPGDDKIFARRGADTVYGGTTALGYQHYLDDRTHGRAVEESLHGGFRATVAADSCGPEIFFYPEVYPTENRSKLTAFIFEDLNANGVRDAGEPDAPTNLTWGLVVTDATGQIVAMGEVPGGKVVAPIEGDFAAGRYAAWVGRYLLGSEVIESIPAGWIPSTPLIASVVLGTTPAPTPPQFGYYRMGTLSGSVKTTGNQPLGGVLVYLDADADGAYDDGETATRTAATGAYSFTDLRPGSYRIAIADLATCGRVTAPATATHAVTLVSGGSAAAYDFRVSPSTAPVVDGVYLGTDTQAITWTSIPGGPAQSAAIPAAEHHYLAFEICTSASPLTIKDGATLTRIDVVPNESIGLTLLPADPARPNWARYEIAKVSGGRTLVPGRYRVVLDDGSVESSTRAVLDGEWINGVSRFPSGDGTAGTDFRFEFVIGGAAGAALTDGVVVSGMAEQGAVIQGTVWQHDPREANAGQSVHERGLADQYVLLSDASGVVQANILTAPLDVNGDGRTSATELGGFRFSNLAPGTYTIQQMPVFPWRQATPGGVWQAETLYAIGFDSSAVNQANWKSILVTIDPATQAASPVSDFSTLEARDLASPAAGVLFITGTSRAGTTNGTDCLWRYDVAAGTLLDLGPTPGVNPLVGFDALDEGTLIGVSLDGIYRYDIATATWEARGGMLTPANEPYWPVGDVAVESATKVWIVGTSPKPEGLGQVGSQDLLVVDPSVLGGNTTRIRSLQPTITEPVIGLETNPQGGLIGLTNGEKLYAIQKAGRGTSSWLGTKLVTGLPNFSSGGLARMPAGVVADATRDEFVLTVTAGQTVTIGFGDVPDAVFLPDGDDFIDGGCGTDDDVLYGDDGADLPENVVTEGGNDWIRGRGGDDTIVGGQQGDRLFGDEGRDKITGGDTEANWIEGGDGDDWYLHGGAAADVIFGGAGNDGNLATGGDGLRGGGGEDLIFGGTGDDTLFGGDGDDTLVGGGGTDLVCGDAGADTLFVIDVTSGGEYAANPNGTLADIYDGGADGDTIVVNADVDSLLTDIVVAVSGRMNTVAKVEIGLLTGGSGKNRIDASGFSGSTAIRGLGDNDTLLGGTGVDRIWGGDGGDTIDGNDGDDFLYGEAGVDTIHGNAGIDRIEGGSGGDSLFGDAGTDILYGGADGDILEGGADNDLLFGEGGADTLRGDAGADLLRGGDQNDTLEGGADDDTLDGQAGDDTIRGGSGNDRLSGAGGSNWLEGGTGDDTYVFAGAFSDSVTEAAGAGSDTLDFTAVTAGLQMLVDPTSSYSISGYDSDAGAYVGASYYANTIEAIRFGSGGDFVSIREGSALAAVIDGGTGTDTLWYAGEPYRWAAWTAGVTVDLAAGTASGLAGATAFETVYGGNGGDTLAGNAAANLLAGGAGNDTLIGRGGDDTLAGGDGSDTLEGGLGDDIYAFARSLGATTDTVTEAAGQGSDTLDFTQVTAPGGIDATIGGSIDVTFGTNRVSVATAAGIDVVLGTGQADVFRLADGAAFGGRLDGYGNPGYDFTDFDTLDYSAWTSAVTVSYLGALDFTFLGTATGTASVRGLRHVIGGTKNDTFTAGGLAVWFEGQNGGDTLVGGQGWDKLEGGAGNDAIDGSWGSDTLTGGTGDDVIQGGDEADWIDGGDDNDTISGGGGGDTLSGGLGSDTILGNAGNDVIDGGRGADSLAGGLGDDIYVFGVLYGNDTVVENAGEGFDQMNFGGVLVPLEVRLGSVTAISTDGTATYAGTSIEWVTGGQGDDLFVMTSPSVTFPGVLEGGGGSNTLRYDAATPAIVAAVAVGQKPNVSGAFDFATVLAVPAITPVTLTVPSLSTVIDSSIRSGNQRIVKQGAGKLILSLANSHTEGTAVEAGEVVVKNVSALGTGGLEIAAGARATLDVGAAGIKIGFIKLDGLLDLGAGSLTVTSGMTVPGLLSSLRAGLGDGSWNGTQGITSGPAGIAIGNGSPRAIGWQDNGDGSFTMRFTVPGDTDLDRTVDILDVSNLLAGARFNRGAGSSWTEGDLNYDGLFDILDVPDFVAAYVSRDSVPSQAAAAPAGSGTGDALSPTDAAFAAFAVSTSGSTGDTTLRKKRSSL
ncbi:MAG: calcium-binding protein [Planctomycetota bacterium]